MSEKHCPECGKRMLNPFGQMFYCEDDCDKKTATEGGEASVVHAEGGWFPLSGFRVIDSPWIIVPDSGYHDKNKILLIEKPALFEIFANSYGFKFKEFRVDLGHAQGLLYFGTNKGLVKFFFHHDDPANQTGFFGATFVLNMADGTLKKVKGPFTSRAGVVNKFLNTEEFQCVTVAMSGPCNQYYRAYVSLRFAHHMAMKVGWTIQKIRRGGEPYYVLDQ